MTVAGRTTLLLLALVGVTACTSARLDPVVKGAGCAQAAEPAAFAHDAESITPPKVLHRVEPRAPGSLVSAGSRVMATVEAIIGEDGKPRHVCIASGHPEWGRAMTDAVKQWVFEPGLLQAKPVAVRFSVTSTMQ